MGLDTLLRHSYSQPPDLMSHITRIYEPVKADSSDGDHGARGW